jgi:hypothetical protein
VVRSAALCVSRFLQMLDLSPSPTTHCTLCHRCVKKKYASNTVWEPPTKQLYSKCQSWRDLPSSQWAQSIAAPISIGSHRASRHPLLRISGPHSPHGCPLQGAPQHRLPHLDYTKLTRHLPTTATGTGPADYRQSQVRHHVAGRNSSPLQQFLVLCSTYHA